MRKFLLLVKFVGNLNVANNDGKETLIITGIVDKSIITNKRHAELSTVCV